MVVVELDHLGAADREEIAALLARAGAGGDHPALPEPQLVAADAPRDSTGAGSHRARPRRGRARRVALLSPAKDGSTVLHIVVDPAARARGTEDAVVSALLGRAVAEAPTDAPVHLWAMQAGPADDDRARRARIRRRARPPPDACPAAAPAGRRGGDPAPGHPPLRARTRRRGLGRHQQPGLRRPPRAGWVDGRAAPGAHGRGLGRARRVPRGRRSRRRRPHRFVLDQGPP